MIYRIQKPDNKPQPLLRRNVITDSCVHIYLTKTADVSILETISVIGSKQPALYGSAPVTSLTSVRSFTLYLPEDQQSAVLSIDGISYEFIREDGNILNDNQQHYYDILVNKHMPGLEQLMSAVAHTTTVDKREMIKSLLVDLTQLLMHRGTKKSMEDFFKFMGYDTNDRFSIKDIYKKPDGSQTTLPNTFTDIKTGYYSAIYQYFKELSQPYDQYGLPNVFVDVIDPDIFASNVINAIRLANEYFTTEEQLITSFNMEMMVNNPRFLNTDVMTATLSSHDVCDFRDRISVNIYSIGGSVSNIREYHVIKNRLVSRVTQNIYDSNVDIKSLYKFDTNTVKRLTIKDIVAYYREGDQMIANVNSQMYKEPLCYVADDVIAFDEVDELETGFDLDFGIRRDLGHAICIDVDILSRLSDKILHTDPDDPYWYSIDIATEGGEHITTPKTIWSPDSKNLKVVLVQYGVYNVTCKVWNKFNTMETYKWSFELRKPGVSLDETDLLVIRPYIINSSKISEKAKNHWGWAYEPNISDSDLGTKTDPVYLADLSSADYDNINTSHLLYYLYNGTLPDVEPSFDMLSENIRQLPADLTYLNLHYIIINRYDNQRLFYKIGDTYHDVYDRALVPADSDIWKFCTFELILTAEDGTKTPVHLILPTECGLTVTADTGFYTAYDGYDYVNVMDNPTVSFRKQLLTSDIPVLPRTDDEHKLLKYYISHSSLKSLPSGAVEMKTMEMNYENETVQVPCIRSLISHLDGTDYVLKFNDVIFAKLDDKFVHRRYDVRWYLIDAVNNDTIYEYDTPFVIYRCLHDTILDLKVEVSVKNVNGITVFRKTFKSINIVSDNLISSDSMNI